MAKFLINFQIRNSRIPLNLNSIPNSKFLSTNIRVSYSYHDDYTDKLIMSSSAFNPIVVFGPSGSGKSTLIKKLQASPDWNRFGFSVSHTTRKPREGEKDGVAYHFISRDEFQHMIERDEFIEHAQFGGNFYGTSSKAVSEVSECQKKKCILDIDAQGVESILKNHPNLKPFIIFICPPSLEELKSRLEGRGTETIESLNSRLAMAKSEIDYARRNCVDLIIVNKNLEEAYQKFHLACTIDEEKSPHEFPKSDSIPF